MLGLQLLIFVCITFIVVVIYGVSDAISFVFAYSGSVYLLACVCFFSIISDYKV